MNARGPAVVWGVLAFVMGMLPAFALAGPAFMADGPLAERLGALALYLAAVFVMGLGGGALAPAREIAITIGLGLPVVAALALLATAGSVAMYALGAGFAVGGFAAAWAGVRAGGRLTAAVLERRKR